MNRHVLLTAVFLGGCAVSARTAPVQPAPPPPPPPAATVQPAPPPPPPPPPAKHPAYLHALTDLRTARAFLERPANIVVKWDEKRAIKEIDDAIHQIKEAAIDDGKDIS